MYPQDAPTQARGWDEGNACAGTGTPIRQWTASPGRPPPPPQLSSHGAHPRTGLPIPETPSSGLHSGEPGHQHLRPG